jgi:transcriptional regulator with XRE-family HTH domain
MPRRPSGPVEEVSPLRRTRLARNWTLEDVVEEIDLRTQGGHSGVTPSMVSGWELGRHTTSIGHRNTVRYLEYAFGQMCTSQPAAVASSG